MCGLNWHHVIKEDQMKNVPGQNFEKMFGCGRKKRRQQHSWGWSYDCLRT